MVVIFCLVIVAAVIAGITFPTMGNFTEYIPYLIGLMLFFNFMDVKVNWQRSNLKVLLVTLLMSAAFMPLFAYHVLSRGFISQYRSGLLLVACAPTGITTLVLGQYIRGSDFNLVMSNFFFTTVCSMLYIPILLKSVLTESVIFARPPLAIIGQLALLALLPYILSSAFSRIVGPGRLINIKKIAGAITLALLFCIVAVSIGKVTDQLTWRAESLWLALSILAVYLIHGGLGYLIGWLWGNPALKITLPFICSSRNMQLVFAIAVLNFPPLTYVPIIMGVFFHHLTNAFWIWILTRRSVSGAMARSI